MLPDVPLLLSVTVNVPVRVPPAAGLKLTLTVQLPPIATELPHVFVCEKSLASVPLIATLLTVSAAVPVLLSVTFWTALVVFRICAPNVRLDGATLATGAVAAPRTYNRWGLPAPVSFTVRLSRWTPLVVGLKVTFNAQ